MNLADLSFRIAAALALLIATACDPDSKEIGSTVGESDTDGATTTVTATGGESTDDGDSATSGTTDPGTTDPGTTDQGTTTLGGTTDGFLECEDATTPQECEAAGDGFSFCGWHDVSTQALDNEGVCGDLGITEGRCFNDSWEDSGCFDYPPTCADGTTRVFFQEVGLEVGAVELVAYEFEDICEAPSGFQPCVFIDDGATQTWDPPECECACPA